MILCQVAERLSSLPTKSVIIMIKRSKKTLEGLKGFAISGGLIQLKAGNDTGGGEGEGSPSENPPPENGPVPPPIS